MVIKRYDLGDYGMPPYPHESGDWCHADAVEELEAENQRLRDALEYIAEGYLPYGTPAGNLRHLISKAKQALETNDE